MRYMDMWRGQTCFIVGGGSSLKDFDWSLLKDKNVIAINRAYEKVFNADVLFWLDDAFFNEHYDRMMFHPARFKMSVLPLFQRTERSDALGMTYLYWEGLRGLSLDATKVCTGKNSGYAAINLAFHFGVSRIVLLGYDMCETKDGSHWHDGYSYNYRPRKLVEYNKWFPNLVEPLKEQNVEVINATNGISLLDCFPIKSLDEVLCPIS